MTSTPLKYSRYYSLWEIRGLFITRCRGAEIDGARADVPIYYMYSPRCFLIELNISHQFLIYFVRTLKLKSW